MKINNLEQYRDAVLELSKLKDAFAIHDTHPHEFIPEEYRTFGHDDYQREIDNHKEAIAVYEKSACGKVVDKDKEITQVVINIPAENVKDIEKLLSEHKAGMCFTDFVSDTLRSSLNSLEEHKDNKVSKERIERIVDEAETDVQMFWDKEVVVSYKLKNGFTLLGRGACVDPKNFDFEIGKQVAREQVINQLWQLEGYLLQCKLNGCN